MSHNPNVDAAEKVLLGHVPDRTVFVGDALAEQLCAKLDAAGLLVTPLMQEACEACEGYYKTFFDRDCPHESRLAVWNAGRALLAAKKPAPRFTVEWIEQRPCLKWVVRDSRGPLDVMEFASDSEAQARAVAAALNGVTP